ncbi:MAG: right-handed parallel beta-helix repeat-containing protein [Parvularculaceae bacterium]
MLISFAYYAFLAAAPVTNAAELSAALNAAKGGEIISLAPGDYEVLALKGHDFAKRVTLTAADPAHAPQFKSIFLYKVSNLAFDGVALRLGPARPLLDYAVTMRESSHISFTRFDVASAADGVVGNDGYGFMIRDCSHVTIADGAIHDTFRGIASFDNNDVVISGVSFSMMGSDGIVARGAVRLTIENNHFADAALLDPKRFHPDAIQLWSRGAVRANDGVIIRNNVVFRGAGDATQGIFIKSPEIASRNLLIENNIVHQSYLQGIFVQNGDGVIIRGNRVEPAHKGDRPGIELRTPIKNANSEHNIAASWRLAPGVTSMGDISTDPRGR